MGFFGIGLFAVPGEAAFLPEAAPAVALAALVALLRGFGLAAAYQGWKRGVLLSRSPSSDGNGGGAPSWSVAVAAGELARGTKETLRGLRVQSKKKALTYRNCLLLVCLGIFSSFMEGLFNIEVSLFGPVGAAKERSFRFFLLTATSCSYPLLSLLHPFLALPRARETSSGTASNARGSRSACSGRPWGGSSWSRR
jgi:hypothetical protein